MLRRHREIGVRIAIADPACLTARGEGNGTCTENQRRQIPVDDRSAVAGLEAVLGFGLERKAVKKGRCDEPAEFEGGAYIAKAEERRVIVLVAATLDAQRRTEPETGETKKGDVRAVVVKKTS